MARTLSTAAQAAKMIRQNLTKQGLKVRVTSENYSMGDNVNVTIFDQNPEVMELVEKYCGNFQYGHFDGMTDCYEYSNKNTDLPQAKHVFVRNEISDATRDAIYQHLRNEWSDGEKLPATYEEGRNLDFHGQWVSERVYRQFREKDSTFWTAHKSLRQAA